MRDPTIEHDIYAPRRLPVPDVHEDSSEAAWALWDEAVEAFDQGCTP